MMFRDMELVIFIGLQASGKRTFSRERFAVPHEHVGKDLFRSNGNPSKRRGQLRGNALGRDAPWLWTSTPRPRTACRCARASTG
jgi:hypothetical protein